MNSNRNSIVWAFVWLLVLMFATQSRAHADECVQQYLGHPRATEQACLGGRRTQPLRCCDIAQETLRARRRISAADGRAVPQLEASYNACGGVIGPMLVDDRDNTYFWSGRWQLHSLDRRGQLRWRFELCDPPSDPLCQDGEDCLPNYSVIPGTVMDYDGVLYFFLGDVMYAVSPDGELLLKRRIAWPSVTDNDPQTRLYLSSGERQTAFAGGGGPGGAPILTPAGNIVSLYVYFSVDEDPSERREPSVGLVRLNRAGKVLDVYPLDSQIAVPHYALLSPRIVQIQDGRVLLAGVTSDDFPPKSFVALLDLESGDFEVARLPRVEDPYSEAPDEDELPSAAPAVGSDGTAYIPGEHGRIWAVRPNPLQAKHIFNTLLPLPYHWQGRPVLDGNGGLFVAAEGTVPVFWSLDTSKLWNQPFAEVEYFGDVAEIPGVNWLAQPHTPKGAWSTPLVADNGRVYMGIDGLRALSSTTGETLWTVGEGSMATAPALLSDGTIVYSQGNTGRVYFLSETGNTPSLARSGWPMAYHDPYHSNSAAHPFRWDRDDPRPYTPVREILPPDAVPSDEADAGDSSRDVATEDTVPDTSVATHDAAQRQVPDRAPETAGCSGCASVVPVRTRWPVRPMLALWALVCVVRLSRSR